MKYKVIFDTNSVRSTQSINDFLGNRSELKKFLEVAEIIIPELVIDELKNQKRKSLLGKRDSFLKNPFHLLRKVDEIETKNFDIDGLIQDIISNEIIPFTVISLTNKNILEKIKEMSLNNDPPFEQNTDKGFKDTYIYFTILEYLETNNLNVFLVTKDERLKSAFNANLPIKVVSDYEEFTKQSIVGLQDDYFIEQLSNNVGLKLTKENITDFWINIEGNYIVLISNDNNSALVEVDFVSREIIMQNDGNYFYNSDEVDQSVNQFINSGSFRNTHLAVEQLTSFKNFLSNEQIINIFTATSENSQIIPDEDVQQFIKDIFEPKKEIVDQNLKLEIEKFLEN